LYFVDNLTVRDNTTEEPTDEEKIEFIQAYTIGNAIRNYPTQHQYHKTVNKFCDYIKKHGWKEYQRMQHEYMMQKYKEADAIEREQDWYKIVNEETPVFIKYKRERQSKRQKIS